MTTPGVLWLQRRKHQPPDTDVVRAAIRLGWFVAELRGRHWWQGQRSPVTELPVDPPYALPLRPERSPAEGRETARVVVVSLAQRFRVSCAFDEEPAEGATFPDRLEALATRLEADHARLLRRPPPGAPDGDLPAREAAWAELAALLHEWDSAIQDSLTAQWDLLANAYLLGRGLAECYWALGVEDEQPPGPTSATAWHFLLGSERRGELGRLVGRVGPHVNSLTPAAVSGSIQAWGRVAADEQWRRADADRTRLYEQCRRWYELLVLGKDPTTYVKPYAILRGWRTSLHAFRAFWPQLLLAVLSAAAVAAVGYFLATNRGNAVLTTLLGLVGALGLTAATVVAKAKSAGQLLIARLRQDAYSDLVAIAVSNVPVHPDSGSQLPFGRPSTEQRVQTAVRSRHQTPSTPLPDAPLVFG
jgi:hypothetical protein